MNVVILNIKPIPGVFTVNCVVNGEKHGIEYGKNKPVAADSIHGVVLNAVKMLIESATQP